jgi:hypothetical protein
MRVAEAAAFSIAVLLLAQAETAVVALAQVTVLVEHLVPQIRAVAEAGRLVARVRQLQVEMVVLVL